MREFDHQLVRTLLERLLSNIVQFWDRRAIDATDGGYRVNYDSAGRWRGPADKFLVAQARTLWYFSRIARSQYGSSEHLASARHGWDFLRTYMWDSEYGGFYWRVRSDGGEVIESDKHLYGQAFALFAFSEYAVAAKSPEAKSFARQLYQLLDERAHDKQFGGYREYLLREWVVPSTGSGYLGHGPSVKSLNTHLHLLEAIMSYSGVAAERSVFDRLRELLQILSKKAVHTHPTLGAYGAERHTDTWVPIDTPEDRRVSYGHDVELAWLLMDADRLFGYPTSEVPRLLFQHALAFGFDARRGGFYESGYFGHLADRRGKVWWVQAEGLLGSLKMFEDSLDPKYADCFLQTLNWIAERQVDWKHGEWHPSVDERGKRSGDKGGPWKTPYHEVRSLLDCLEILDQMPQGKNL